MTEMITAEEIFSLYERCYQNALIDNLFTDTQKNRDFYIGKQWRGLSGGEELPVLNFIKPTGKYKISLIAQNLMSIVYGSFSGDSKSQNIAKYLSRAAAAEWENSKLDSLSWQIIKNAFITGEGYLFCYRDESESSGGEMPRLAHDIISNTNIFFENETVADLQRQKYILIAERLPVSLVREMAQRNGIPEDDVERIVSDNDLLKDSLLGKAAYLNAEEFCTSVMYMEKTAEGILFAKAVSGILYKQPTLIKGLYSYPVASLKWECDNERARGISGVQYMIPNQIEVNKTAARRAVAVKRFAFPTLVYDGSRIENIDKIGEVGANIKVNGLMGNPINTIIGYLNPSSTSADASRLQSELLEITRALEGASDTATGAIDPTKASGEAIKAARDQAAIPLNEQVAAFRQFVEDLAKIWLFMWFAYCEDRLLIDGVDVTRQELLKTAFSTKIDVSPTDPFSKASSEIALERLFSKGDITFDEYVSMLDDSSTVPKNKLLQILSARESGSLESGGGDEM